MKFRSGVGLGARLVPLILIIMLILGGISSLATASEETANDGDNDDAQEREPSSYSVKTDTALMWALVIFVISMVIYCFIVKMDLGI